MRKRKVETSFAERLAAWAEQQPEVTALRAAPRSVRKAMGREAAAILTRVPVDSDAPVTLNRKAKRAIRRDVMRRAGDSSTILSKRRVLLETKARRDRLRTFRLSMKRLAVLEARKVELERAQATRKLADHAADAATRTYVERLREDLGLEPDVAQVETLLPETERTV